MIRFSQHLNENRVQWLKDNTGEIDSSHDELAVHREPHAIIDHFAAHDPSPKKTYTPWMINQYKKQNIRQEDASDIGETLKNFDRYKGKLDKKDINQYKHPSDLNQALVPHLGQAASRKEEKKGMGALIHQEAGVKVFKLNSAEEATHFSKEATRAAGVTGGFSSGTASWCTVAPNMFHSYAGQNNEKPIYVIHAEHKDPLKTRYQFHFETGQFADAKDRNVGLPAIADQIPAIRNVKEFQGRHMALENDESLNKRISEGHLFSTSSHSPHSNLKNFIGKDTSGRLTTDTLKAAHALHKEKIEPEIFSHPNAPKSIIHDSFNHHAAIGKMHDSLTKIAGNPGLTADDIHGMHEKVKHKPALSAFTNAIALHPNIGAHTLDSIAHNWSNNAEGADRAFNHPNTHPDTFRKLHGADLAVDASMSMSPHTPHDILHKLASHENEFVAEEARDNLSKRTKTK